MSKKDAAGIAKKDSMHEAELSFTSIGSNAKYEDMDVMNPVPSTIRQVAHEVIRSIDRYVTIVKSTNENKVTITINS